MAGAAGIFGPPTGRVKGRDLCGKSGMRHEKDVGKSFDGEPDFG